MNKNWWLFAILLIPLLAAQFMHSNNLWPMLMLVLLSAALVVLLIAAQHQKSGYRGLFKTLLIAFYFVFLFMLLFEVILFDFSGKGFTNEVYFHFEFESLRIGFNEYPIQLVAFALLVTCYVFLINKLLQNSTKSAHFLFKIIAILVLITVAINSSLARFSNGLIDYIWQDSVELNEALINQYVDLGILQNGNITTKKHLKAETNTGSKNLILVYLESFNQGLLDLKDYPGLTPQLNQLTQRYQNLNHIASSFVTIEGIISSQCGTMLPMTAGNNTFLNEGQLLSNMPCMGDVLKRAGYTQYYLGGAQMEFAGKGRFLESHGYDHIWGLEHWKTQGFQDTEGIWGLGDNELFKNAIQTIKEAAKKPPYNVTLLTLGTHLPGYTYQGCNPYVGSDEPFINAIHCTDQLVGQFVDELERAQLLDDTVLMIVADHGIFPSTKMRELFGGKVEERRLVGLTNYPQVTDEKLSSYDLAPTLLDMLKINHNASFLFGQSLFQKLPNQQQYVTRYEDWLGDTMKFNPKGDCEESQKASWPLNSCEKQILLNLTSQLLEHYSIKDTPEPLSCELDIKFIYEKNEFEKWQWSLWLNEEDHFEHFYHKGYLLKTLNYRAGIFIFVLNDQLAIEKHIFIEKNDEAESNFSRVLQSIDAPVLVIKSKIRASSTSQNGEAMSLEINLYHQQAETWGKITDSDVISGINICQ